MAILVNIFAGINRCDWVAQGVVNAVASSSPPCRWWCASPARTSKKAARFSRTAGSSRTADTLTEAAEKVVAALKASGGTAGNGKP